MQDHLKGSIIRKFFDPGSRAVLGWLAVFLMLSIIPLVNDSRAVLNLLMSIYVAGIMGMSYNLLLGFTGIVSFGQALFFGSGAYAIAIMVNSGGLTLGYMALGVVCGFLFAGLVGLVTGYLSLRVKDVYYAMITLAFAEIFVIIAEKWRTVTGGVDGLAFMLPPPFDSWIVAYYVVLASIIVTLIFMVGFVASPTGKVLVAIRENEQRAQALGYNIFHYKLKATIISSLMASLAGMGFALQNQFVRSGVLGVDKTIDALLITVIGGMGTVTGPILGSVVMNLSKEWLSDLAKIHPIFEQWNILFGLLFILIVLFFPKGIMGGLEKFKLIREKVWKRV